MNDYRVLSREVSCAAAAGELTPTPSFFSCEFVYVPSNIMEVFATCQKKIGTVWYTKFHDRPHGIPHRHASFGWILGVGCDDTHKPKKEGWLTGVEAG